MVRTLEERFLGKATAAVLTLVAVLVVPGCVSVTSFNPETGNAGTAVTINGSGFKPDPAGNTVKFGGEPVPTTDVLSATATELQVLVPTAAKTGLISVSNSKGTGQSKKNFVVPSTSKWTFMIYLDADNNLESAGIDDFLEMASVGSTAQMKIVVQMDRVPGFTSSHGNWTGTRRFLVQPGDNPGMAPVQDLGEQNMGDPAVLQDFVEWGVTNYPSEHYALVIWNHGGGWRDIMDARTAARARGDSAVPVARAVAWDDTDNDSLYMKEVQTALEGAKDRSNTLIKLDVLGFDACLMQMAEVAYAVRKVANYVVASEELEPGDGWPYDTILQSLDLNPGMTPSDLAGVIVSKYGAAYSSGITQSAVEIGKLGDLVTKVDGFTSAATSEWAMLKAQRLASRDYPYSLGVDLRDFADRVHGAAVSPTIKAAALELRDAVDDFVIHEAHSADMAGSYGAAIYFPGTQAQFNADPDHSAYDESNTFMPVDFVTYTTWDNWLQDYYSNVP
ncbi:MAG: clostripain-related cysteine peptidase [Acidobacteriota bacterium]|nr:clostripain-related cysteine peptidase [Acidobacteriota bacterium]MDH3523834.1 clostripain-related cysteine peptidase [Acidobacteriota bacterium]